MKVPGSNNSLLGEFIVIHRIYLDVKGLALLTEFQNAFHHSSPL